MKVWEAADSLEKLKKEIASKDLKRFYLIYGEERFLCQFYFKKLMSMMGADPDDMNTTIFDSDKVSVDKVIEQAEVLPFFADRRIIVVKNSGLVNTGDGPNKLAAYIEEPAETVSIIFYEDDVNETSKLYKAIREKGTVCEIVRQDRNYLKKNFANKLKHVGKGMTGDDADYLISMVGSDMSLLDNEMEKLISYTGDAPEITRADIDAICSRTVEDKINIILSLIVKGDTQEVLTAAEDLLEIQNRQKKRSKQKKGSNKGMDAAAIISMLSGQILYLLEIRDLRENGFSADGVSKLLTKTPDTGAPARIQDWKLKKMFDPASKVEKRQLQRWLALCADATERIRTGRIDEDVALETLLIEMTKKG